jgi:hypothetical protein
MAAIVKTFNGFVLNNSSYQAAVVDVNSLPNADLAFLQQMKNDPSWSGAYFGEARGIPVVIRIQNYATRFTLCQTLKAALKPGTTGVLVVTLDNGVDYQLTATVTSMVPNDDQTLYTAVLQSGPAAWQAVSAETDSWSPTGSGGTKGITVSGTVMTRLSLNITPTSVTSGWLYQQLYQLVNPPAIKYGSRPWCITLNTATLVSAGYMLASGYDLRIIVNDVEVPRWIPNPNNAATNVWFNLNFDPGYSLTLLTPVSSGGGVTALVFQPTANNKAALTAMPAAGILYHGTEWFKYSGKNVALYTVSVTARGVLGTTQQAHAAGDTFKHIQNVIYILYGNSSATDPAATNSHYDDNKPLFDLTNSSNSSWVYSATTGFQDPTNTSRPGSWKPSLTKKGDQSTTYLFTQNGGSGNLVAGMLEACWILSGRLQNETATIAWQMDCPGGIASITSTGSKRATTTSWPALAALQKSANGASWSQVWNESIPGTLNSWTAISHTGDTIGTNSLRFLISGSLKAVTGAEADLEIGTATVTFTSGNLPVGSLLGQVNQIHLNIALQNQTTGDTITLIYPMILNRTLVVDGENYLLSCDGVNVHGALTPDDGGRDVWIRLAPGANTLAAVLTNQGNLTIALSWLPRQL